MIYRKGELSKAAIDAGWPHQVALPASSCTGAQRVAIHELCRTLSLCPRGHFFYRDSVGYNVFCFADPLDAATFRDHFGGELIAPKDRPRWPGR